MTEEHCGNEKEMQERVECEHNRISICSASCVLLCYCESAKESAFSNGFLRDLLTQIRYVHGVLYASCVGNAASIGGNFGAEKSQLESSALNASRRNLNFSLLEGKEGMKGKKAKSKGKTKGGVGKSMIFKGNTSTMMLSSTGFGQDVKETQVLFDKAQGKLDLFERDFKRLINLLMNLVYDSNFFINSYQGNHNSYSLIFRRNS